MSLDYSSNFGGRDLVSGFHLSLGENGAPGLV